MYKLETVVAKVIESIKTRHTHKTFEVRKQALNKLLRFAKENGFDEPCQELYDAFTSDDKGSPDIRFSLNHAVRLVDKIAETHAKDLSGKFYNEPSLPSKKQTEDYFLDVKFPISDAIELNYLIVLCEQRILNYELTASTVGQYQHAWIDIRRYCFTKHFTTYNKDIILDFIADSELQCNQGKIKPWKWKINRKAASVLIEVAETGTFNWKPITCRELSCGEIKLDYIRNQYIESLKSKNLETATISLHDYVFRYSMRHGNINSYEQLSKISTDNVSAIINVFSTQCSKRSISTIIPILRNILHYLYENNVINTDFSGMIMSPFVQRNHVPAYISSDDDIILFNALSHETLRNKAILLLALNFGLRDSDICNLRLSNIDWNNDCIYIQQKKTASLLRLPLLSEVGNALMEYIIKERPAPRDGYPFVFRRVQAPYNKLSSVYTICKRFIKRNNIHTVNRDSYGIYIFRYRTVNRLLRVQVPHQVITDILGHKSKESDKPYISMEPDMLRMCALDLSLCGGISWKGASDND